MNKIKLAILDLIITLLWHEIYRNDYEMTQHVAETYKLDLTAFKMFVMAEYQRCKTKYAQESRGTLYDE
jgi:hypothetical protein